MGVPPPLETHGNRSARQNSCVVTVLLLLRHLLLPRRRRWLLRQLRRLLHQHRPVLRHRQLLIQRRRPHARRHPHRDSQLTRRPSAKDPMRRRHIGIVPPNRGANMPVARHQPVRRIEPHPPQMRNQSLNPRMRRRTAPSGPCRSRHETDIRSHTGTESAASTAPARS